LSGWRMDSTLVADFAADWEARAVFFLAMWGWYRVQSTGY
jgi:hypothetical protein